jgi:C-terminal processing protease CtpA/Prc
MGHVAGHRLGESVGAATAGTNGEVNPFVLPGGFRIAWTGMKVVKHDGSPHHVVGVRATVPVERTLAGVRAGRDEVLEKALERLRTDAR